MKSVTDIFPGFDKCKKATLQNNYFWETPPNDCFCLEIYNRKYCFCLVSCTSAVIFFLIDRCQKCLKNTMDQLLFYKEHFYGFSESDLWKHRKKTHSFHNIHIYMYSSQTFWSFVKFYGGHIVKVCFVFKKTVTVLIFLCICVKHSRLRKWERTRAN